jgi:hypothetical protein
MRYLPIFNDDGVLLGWKVFQGFYTNGERRFIKYEWNENLFLGDDII